MIIEKVKQGYYHWIEDYGMSETLLSGISRWTNTLPESELRLIIRLLKHTELSWTAYSRRDQENARFLRWIKKSSTNQSRDML